MIRFTKHINTNYIVIDSTLEVDNITVPIQVQVNINNLSEIERSKIYRIANTAFNRNINFNKPKPQPKKPWYKFW